MRVHSLRKLFHPTRSSDPPGRGRKFVFYGAFKLKTDAVEKERSNPGSFIQERKIKGEKRFVVMKPKGE